MPESESTDPFLRLFTDLGGDYRWSDKQHGRTKRIWIQALSLVHGLALNEHSQVNGANTSFSVAKIKVMIYVKA